MSTGWFIAPVLSEPDHELFRFLCVGVLSGWSIVGLVYLGVWMAG